MFAFLRKRRGVAQLVARCVRDAKVVGSNPVASTKNPYCPRGSMDFLIIRLATGFEGGSRFAGAKRFARKRLKNKKARRQRRQLKIAERGAPLKAQIRRLDQKSILPKGWYGFFILKTSGL